MAYQINRYNNSFLTTVLDGTINNTTDLKFIGRNFAGYGEIQNENFLFLLENFSGLNPPPKALSGQLWYDSGLQKLKFYDGVKWRTTGGAETESTEPSGLSEGDFWWDNANDQLYVFNGVNFILIGPQNAGEGVTQFISRAVLDTTNTQRSIIEATINDEVITIFSLDGPFDLATSNPIPGFDRIRQGITLIDTENSRNGVTGSNFRFWGTASNAERLGGNLVSNFILKDDAVFDSRVDFTNDGVAIGESLGFKFFVDNISDAIIQNENGVQSEIRLITTDNTENLVHSVTVNSLGLIPPQTNTYQIGSPNNIWNIVYAAQFEGEASRAATLRVDSNFRTASVNPTPNTVAVRDASGNLKAVLFEGTATQARYADLAEKYSTEQEWPIGTAMAVCDHADHETGPANAGSIAIGVISENPAYLMNSEAEGQAIALKGRVPVRVIGAVRKGQAVYAWENGVCSTVATSALVGVALNSNTDEGEKLVECVLKT
jgi:hypothetical protein